MSNPNEKKPIDAENRSETGKSLHFIEQIIAGDAVSGKFGQRVHTRFPPEPNGYLHIGHAKSICLNYAMAHDNGGEFNLRFDDTNPAKEETEYVESIKADVRWLGADWEDRLFFASDYFSQMYEWAVQLIKQGDAYVCDMSQEEVRAGRGTPTEPGVESPGRKRSVEENLDLFERMKNGEFPDGSKTLRAKIDMGSPNFNMRDPVMYRILHAEHHRTGNAWCIYPMYDWAHGLEDSIEKITHSICTLEFEHHRPLYDWFLDRLGVYHPQQIEFARLNLTYTVMSKRKLLELVKGKTVSGWDDPRLPTICGLRRRGYTPESIRDFCRKIGVAKFNSTIDVTVLENSIREELNKTAPRRMAVLRPLKLVIDNYPEGETELLDAINNPEENPPVLRKIPFSRELWIERDDFLENAPKKYFRLTPGQEVRLRYAYFVTCTGCEKDVDGNITTVHAVYDPATKGGDAPDGRKVKGTIHWLSAADAKTAEIRLYDRLFSVEHPDDASNPLDYKEYLNPESLEIISDAKIEPALFDAAQSETRFQFERIGYFYPDKDSSPEKPVFNRIASLRDTWSKIAGK